MSERLFDENKTYVAKIVSQEFVAGFNDQPQVVLRVALGGTTKVKENLASGVDAFAEGDVRAVERSLYFDLDPGNTKLDKVMKELKALGMNFTDVRRLHPAHPKAVSFVGKDVLVRVWYKPTVDKRTGLDTERERWFVVVPRGDNTFDYSKFDELFQANDSAYAAAADADE